MNFFSFFSGGMGRGAKQKEMIIFPLGSFLGMKGITYELCFFPEANDIFNEIKIGHFKTKKISKKKLTS